jgi:Ca2+-binding RTX toxin-like protein
MPGTVQNLTLSYDKTSGASSNGGALLSVTSTAARSLTINNVAFTGTHSGWNGNGNLYMSLRSFSSTSPLNTTLTLSGVKVSITGQNNSFNGTTGGSAFLHNWNNNGVVTITGSEFDEAGFRSSFNFVNFTAPSSTTAAPVHIISNNTFKRTSNATVRPEGNVLSNVNATLTGNTFQDGSFVDIGGNVGGLTFNGNTFNTIADGYGIRVTGAGLSGSPTFTGTNTFTGTGLALKFISTTGGTADFINYSGTFSVGGKSFARLIASGQGNDNLQFSSLTGTNLWISGDAGNDTIVSSNGADCLIGGTGNDSLISNAGNDVLDGGDGSDVLDGAAGTDSLNGGADNDTLIGGSGIDTLTGGTGADVFQWANLGGNDVITDFTNTISEIDKIALVNIPFVPAPATVPGAIDSNSYQSVASIVSSTVLNGKITELTSSATSASILGLTVSNAALQAGYVLFFDTTSNKGQLVYDGDWRNTGNRQVCFTFNNLTSLTSVTDLTFANFMAV